MTAAERATAAICIVFAVYALGMTVALLWAFREQIHYNPYSYNTIFYFGFALFAFSVMVTSCILAVRAAHAPEPYSPIMLLHTLIGSAQNYMIFSTPFLLIFSAALCVSNVALILGTMVVLYVALTLLAYQ